MEKYNVKKIESLREMCVKLEVISVYDTCAYSNEELVYLLIKKINECVITINLVNDEVTNEIIIMNEKIAYLLDEGLAIEVSKFIEEMKTSGELADIINVTIFDDLNKKIDELIVVTSNIYRELNHVEDDLSILKNDFAVLEKTVSVIVTETTLNKFITGNVILDPTKEYNITGCVFLDNTTLDGRGAKIQGLGEVLIGNNVTIKNCIFTSTSEVKRDSRGIYVSGEMLYLHAKKTNGVIFENNNCDCIELAFYNSSNFAAKNNFMLGGRSTIGVISLYDNCSNGTIFNNEIKGCLTNAIGLSNSKNISINSNDLSFNGHSGIYTTYCSSLIISGNSCYEHNIYDGIDLNLSADLEDYSKKYNCIVENNTCYNNASCGIYVSGSGITIKDNILYKNGRNGLRFFPWKVGGGQKSTDNIISGNRIYNNATSVSGEHNFVLQNVFDTIVKNNIVYVDELNSNFIYNLDAIIDNCFIVNNIFENRNPDLGVNSTINLSGGSNNIQISNVLNVLNRFSGMTFGINKNYGTLSIGELIIGQYSDGNYYLVAGTEKGNKSIKLD